MANQPTDVFKYVNMLTGPVHPRLGTRCWPWTGALSDKGRPYFRVNGKLHLAYRLVYTLVTGRELRDATMLLHQCDNPVCCNPQHLLEGEHKQNMREMRERERHGLPHYAVRAIRKLAAEGRSHKEIAELYGIGRSTVSEIVGKVNYKEVE